MIVYKEKLHKLLTETFNKIKESEIFDVLDFSSIFESKNEWKQIRHQYRQNDVKNLVHYYNSHVSSQSQVIEKQILQDWNAIKAYLQNLSTIKTNQEIYQEIFLMGITEEFMNLIKFYLIQPVSNASVERGFSLMNLIKSDIRSCITDDLLDSSLAIKYNGPPIKDLPVDSAIFQEAETIWKLQKKRRFCI